MLEPLITDLFEQLLHCTVYLSLQELDAPISPALSCHSPSPLPLLSRPHRLLRRDLEIEERFLEPHPNNLAKAIHPSCAVI